MSTLLWNWSWHSIRLFWKYNVSHSVTPQLIYRGIEIFEKHGRGAHDFLVKISYRGEHYFTLVVYGFCSNNALYSASHHLQCLFLLYFLFTFLLIHENVNILNQISACIKSVAYKKACNIVLKSSKHEETTKKKTFKLYGHFFIDGVQLPQG